MYANRKMAGTTPANKYSFIVTTQKTTLTNQISDVDAVVFCPDMACAERNVKATNLTIKALEDAGYPVLKIEASYLDGAPVK